MRTGTRDSVRLVGTAGAIFTALKVVPLVFIAIVGVFFLKGANFGGINSPATSAFSAVAGAGEGHSPVQLSPH